LHSILDGNGRKETAVAGPEAILEWLKEAGAYAFQCEDLDRIVIIDVLVGGGTVVEHPQQLSGRLRGSTVKGRPNNSPLKRGYPYSRHSASSSHTSRARLLGITGCRTPADGGPALVFL
jgi:hypothetical protein